MEKRPPREMLEIWGSIQTAVFNDYDYRLLSNDKPVSIEALKTMDKADKRNLELYKDMAYKVINADKAVDLGLYDEKVLKMAEP